MDRSTIYRVVRRWVEEGPEGLEDKKRGRPKGVRKVDLRAMDAVRRLQENPELGAFRMQAALEQAGIHLSASEPLAGSSKPTATSTSWTNRRGVRIRSARCRSRRAPDTKSGHRMCATSTTPCRKRATSTSKYDPRELLQGNPRECANAHPGHERLPLRALRGHRTLRIAEETRQRRRRHLPLPSGHRRLRGSRHRERRDRAPPTLAKLHRDHV